MPKEPIHPPIKASETTTLPFRPGPPPAPGAATATTAPMPRIDTLIGKVLNGRYKVTELIAKGGMGRVYKAEQAPLGRIVALKVLDGSDDVGQDAEFRGRFSLEAGATAKLTHPNTIRIFDYGQTSDDIFYIAMEYLDGRTLHQTLKEEGPMSPERVIHVIRQVCASLREAHALGLIHRDLKPSNVVLLRAGEEAEFAKVLDFGLVKEVSGNSELTRLDAVVGSPSYMSPEQIRSSKVDSRSDIYSLGVLMYTCLAGKPPFTGVSSVNLLMAHLHNTVPPITERAPLDRAPILAWIVMTCLEKEPDARFGTVEELSRALRIAASELRGDRPSKPTLTNGKLVLQDEPTPSSSMRLAPPPGVRGEDSRSASSRSSSSRAGQTLVAHPSTSRSRAPESGFPWWAAVLIGIVGLGGIVILALAMGGAYMSNQIVTPEVTPAPEVMAAPVAPAPPPAASTDPLPGSQPAAGPVEVAPKPTRPATKPTASTKPATAEPEPKPASEPTEARPQSDLKSWD